MKILLTVPLRSFTGEVLKDGPNSDLLLRNVLIGVLSLPGEKENTYAEAALHFSLGVRVAVGGNEIDLSQAEVDLLKFLLPKRFSPLVVGQVGMILDGLPTGIVPALEAKPAKLPDMG